MKHPETGITVQQSPSAAARPGNEEKQDTGRILRKHDVRSSGSTYTYIAVGVEGEAVFGGKIVVVGGPASSHPNLVVCQVGDTVNIKYVIYSDGSTGLRDLTIDWGKLK